MRLTKRWQRQSIARRKTVLQAIPTETVSVRRKSVYHLGQFPIFGTASGAGLEAIETFLVRFDS